MKEYYDLQIFRQLGILKRGLFTINGGFDLYTITLFTAACLIFILVVLPMTYFYGHSHNGNKTWLFDQQDPKASFDFIENDNDPSSSDPIDSVR